MARYSQKKAFSLLEVLIVTCILGIIAAIITPQISKSSTKAREAAAKENLHILRTQIDRYALQHKETPPGYADGDTKSTPLGAYMVVQLTFPTNIKSQWNQDNTDEFCYGPYISKFPKNPFNHKRDVFALTAYPGDGDWPAAGDTYGWLYYPKTNSVRLNTLGDDSAGVNLQSY